MTTNNISKLKYALPRGENLLYIVMQHINDSRRRGNEVEVTMAPLVQRAYNIVYETGVILYQEYTNDTTFIEKQ